VLQNAVNAYTKTPQTFRNSFKLDIINPKKGKFSIKGFRMGEIITGYIEGER
jgi:hypothetical protein